MRRHIRFLIGFLILASFATNADAGTKSTRKSYHRAVMLVGMPGKGTGTAWVLSRKHRLLVTNAHVADMFIKNGGMKAMLNGTDSTYQVKRAWYHPGIKRQLRGESRLVVRSMKSADGPVFPFSPDIAVLQLATGGKPLPAELSWATPDELKELQGEPVSIFGYPGTDTFEWPKRGEIASATFDRGDIRRVTNFQLTTRANAGDNQFVEHSTRTIGGFSGSPLFLKNGHVVAVHNSGYTMKVGGKTRRKAHGVRIDCLWELIVHHKLAAMIPTPLEPSDLNVRRWLKPLPKEADYRKAVKLVDEAQTLIFDKLDHQKGIAKCSEALKLAGTKIGFAHQVRANGYLNYWFHNKSNMSQRTQFAWMSKARADSVIAVECLPADSTVWGLRTAVSIRNNLGQITGNRKYNHESLAIIDSALKKLKLSNWNKAHLLSQKGISLDNLGRDSEALRAHNEAIALEPKAPLLWENRADYWRANGQYSRRNSDLAKARELRKGK